MISKAPWTLKTDPYVGIKILDADGFRIAVVDGVAAHTGDDLDNAKLMIAAQGLLSALRQIADNGTLGLQQHDEARTLREAVFMARIAIAQATGGAP